MKLNFWRRLRVGGVKFGEQQIKRTEIESAAKLRRLAEERKLAEARLEKARKELPPTDDPSASLLLAQKAQLWLFAPLLVGALALAIFSNKVALEPVILDWAQRLVYATFLPVVSLLGGPAVGFAIRMPKGAFLKKTLFGVGFTLVSIAIVGTISLNLMRTFDIAALEEYRRSAISASEDVDARDQPRTPIESHNRKNLVTGLLSVFSISMGVAGELASAFAFDHILFLFFSVFPAGRLRREVRRLEDRLVEISGEEETVCRRPELERAIVAADMAEIVEFQEAAEGGEAAKGSKNEEDDDDSLAPLAWKIVGTVLVLAAAIILSVSGAFGGGRLEAQTVILLDLSNSVSSNEEFNRDRTAVEGIIKRIDDAGHRLSIFGIGDSSFSQPPLLPTATTPAEIGRYREYLEGWKRGIIAKWRKVSERLSPSAKCTDLFGAIARAAIEFEESPASKKRLVILSDMRQACRGYNFEKPLDDPHLLIKRVECEGLIPKLDSIEVWVLGAHTTRINEAQWSKLKVFWIEYFNIAGAKLKTFSPNRRLGELGGNQ